MEIATLDRIVARGKVALGKLSDPGENAMQAHLSLRSIPTALLLLPSVLGAQGAPGTDIFLVSLRQSGTEFRLGEPRNITDRAGYDNQPSFLPDGRSLLYTSNRDGQTDIYRYYIRTRATRQVTNTAPESEYSPTVTPAHDAFTVIRVEADSTQRLWQFDLDGRNPRVVLTDVKPVGYHAWGNDHTVALFVLGDSATPATLRLADTRTGQSHIIAYRIGRSLHKIPGRDAVSFAHRVPDYWVKELDLASQSVRPIVQLLEGNEFYAWLTDGSVIMGAGSRLFRWRDGGGGWVELADLESGGVRGISRIAVSPAGDWLAIVGTHPND